MRFRILVIVLLLITLLPITALTTQAAPAAQNPVYTIFDVTQLNSCTGDWSHATINPGDYLTILGTVGYVVSFQADLMGMHSMISGDIPVSGLLSVKTTGADIAFQNVAFPTMPIVVSLCQSPFVPTTTPTPLSSLPAGCIAKSITVPSFFSVTYGTTISVASGSLEYGSNLGVSWTPLVVGSTLFIPFSGSVYFRGSGVLYVCLLAETSTPISTATTTPSGMSTDICGPGDVLYNNYYTVPFLRANGLPPISIISVTVPAKYASLRLGLSKPSITNFYRQYSSGSGFGSFSLWPSGVGSPSVAISPWPSGINARVGTVPVNRIVTFEWHTDAVDPLTVVDVGVQRVCVTGVLSPTSTPTRTTTPATATSTATAIPTATGLATRTPLPAVSRTPTRTSSPTATLYPTSMPGCAQGVWPRSTQMGVFIPENAYIRAVNGTAYIDGGVAGGAYTLNAAGMIWELPSGTYLMTPLSISDGSSLLQIEICALGQPGPTATMTAPILPCAIASAYQVGFEPLWITFTKGAQFVVADVSIYVNMGATAKEIRSGTYKWEWNSGSYNVYTIVDLTAHLWLCDSPAASPTATFMPTWTPGVVIPVGTIACVLLPSLTPYPQYAMPSLSLVLPTMRALPTMAITATTSLSITAVAGLFGTIESGISTPESQIRTVVANYSWQAGSNRAATAITVAAPALAWISVLNPSAPAWSLEGGPLWAIAPLVLPILPIIVVRLSVVIARFVLWMVAWVLKLIDLIIKLIELIPGE
jgi:hypothetical protein